MYHLIIARPEPPGKFTAQVVGIPDIRAVADTEPEAIEKARQTLTEWLATAHWVQVDVPVPPVDVPRRESLGPSDPNEPVYQMYLEEMARFRREDMDRALREDEQECSTSSSTPTT